MSSQISPKLETSQVELEITVPPEDFKPYLAKATRNLTKDKALPGFRPGKAPLPVVIDTFGQERVLHEAMDLALPKFFVEAALENNIDSINRPAITVEELGIDKPFRFRAMVDVLPKVTLGNIKDLKAEKRAVTITPEEVVKELNYLAKMRSQNNIIPELNDEFAQKVGKFTSLDHLKEELTKNMQQEKDKKEQERYRSALMESMATQATFGFIPEILIAKEIDRRLEELQQLLAYQQKTIDQYLAEQNKTLAQVREDIKPAAETGVKVALAIRQFAVDQKIEVPEEEIAKEANEYLKHYKTIHQAQKDIDPQELHDQITSHLTNEKTLQKLEELTGKYGL